MRTPLASMSALALLTVPTIAAPYIANAIFPNVPAATRDAQLLDFYQQWKSTYFTYGCGEGRAYVDVGGDDKPVYGGTEAHTITVSEAHGYGMLALVMMADVDSDAHADFDAMVRYFHDHPSLSSPHLLAWNQVEGCADAGDDVGGTNTATDGDLDIAYALLLADKVWGSAGELDYAAEARATMDAIMAYEVEPVGMHLGIGDWALRPDDTYFRNTTRSSDFMTSHLRAFAEASGQVDWYSVLDRTYAIIDAVRASHAAGTGLMPDFIVDLDTVPRPADAVFLEGEADGMYSWNAGRYPWRIALDYLTFGEARAKAAIDPVNAWIRASTGDDPTKIADTYGLDGSTLPNHGENSMAFVAPFGVAAMIDPANQAWLDAIWADVVDKPVADEDYFGNTLKLLSMIAMSGHWASP
ncbi:glycosyl hydrolase family 8 [Devosia sp. SL43]|uniref:glycosyl hydrolase family 8 n=1 Tax=Devosia sp. SL43 TaxID=2806348 RepID=UPI001F02835A|nr:glycosyl hydrolase family 8 [Devosia sp. SL43]UJW86675.1 licheninase [Devosia sp. SL43]